MRVRLMGAFTVEGVEARDLGSRKGRTLLKVLALAEGRAVGVDRLADILWGDDQPARPAEQVGVLVSRLRGALGAERLTRSEAGYALDVDWLDVAELRKLASAAARALADGRVGAARAAAGAALELTGGELLPTEGDWVRADRAAVDATVAHVNRVAVDAAAAAGDHGGAAALAEQALARDPYDEDLLRRLMAAHLAARRPAAALAAYARMRARLADELGVPLTAETENLHGQALAAADGDVPAQPPDRPATTGLVGRERELHRLDGALAAVAAGGGGSLVLVEGEVGIGKTSVVEAWSVQVDGRATVLRGRCDELGRDLPLQPITDALVAHLRAVGPEGAAALLGDGAPALAPLLGTAPPPAATVVADADAARARTFAALAEAVDRAGGNGPTVLVVEDLHAASNGTRAWLAFAARRCARTLVVATTRPGGAPGIHPAARLVLGPLDRDAVAALVGPERAPALHARSDGHPLLLAALAGAPPGAPASTVGDVVAERVDSLGDDVGATLRVAAVLGPDCDLDLVAQVVGRPLVDVLAHLEAAARAGLVVERGNRFEFRHQLVREALGAATGAARRALVHRQAARALAARPRPDPLAVALHARAGGDSLLASTSFAGAAAAAAARFDLEAADEHLASALALAPAADAFTARARVRMARQALDEAAEDAREAVARGGGAAALEAAGWVAYYRRRYDEAGAFAEEAAARATDPAVLCSARALAGRIRHAVGDLAGAVGHLTATAGAPPPVRGVADVWLAQVRVHQGRPHEALAALARPLVDADSLAHPWAPLHLRFVRVLALGQLGRVSAARQALADLEAAAERAGAVGARFAAPVANVGAWLLRWSGQAGAADERNARAAAMTADGAGSSATAFAEAHHVALLDLADGCLVRSDLAGAAELAGALAPLETAAGTMAWHQRHRLGLLRARLALAGGDRDRAGELAGAVAGDAESRGAGRYRWLAEVVGALADPALPTDRLVPAVEGLCACAVLDGWPLLAALGASRRSDALAGAARRLAATVVAEAGTGGPAVTRFVDGVLGAPRPAAG